MQPGMGWQGTGVWGQRRPLGSYLLVGAVVVAGLYLLNKSYNPDTKTIEPEPDIKTVKSTTKKVKSTTKKVKSD